MQSQLDQAITAAASAEATVLADQTNVGNIQTAIATATAPLKGAQDTLGTDTVTFNKALDDLIAAATAAKLPTPTPTPTPAP